MLALTIKRGCYHHAFRVYLNRYQDLRVDYHNSYLGWCTAFSTEIALRACAKNCRANDC